MLHSPDVSDHVSFVSTSAERDKPSHLFNNEIFDRLVQFGTESDRPSFCQRLHQIWQEQSISCQSYPTITNQILDLYKLYRLVQEKQGYLEITTNRGWKEVSTVLGFGDSGSAAYSVKRNYVRLGLLAYECRFDRVGLEPRSVIELSEMPHTVKKRKRTNQSVPPVPRAIVKTKSPSTPNQPPPPVIVDETPKSFTPPSTTTSSYSSRGNVRLKPEQMPITDLSQFPFIIRGGRLGESNRHLDTLLVWLSDPRTASYFHLKPLPGLLNALLEQYLACLYELFGSSIIQRSPMNDLYIDWFLQVPFQIHPDATGPSSKIDRLESLFFGTPRYLLKRMTDKKDQSGTTHSSDEPLDEHRHQAIVNRCATLTTIIRNLSFIDENLYLANDYRLLDILERVLKCQHDLVNENYADASNENQRCPFCVGILDTDERSVDTVPTWISTSTKTPTCKEDSLVCRTDCEQHQWIFLLDNTLVTLSNLAAAIELHSCPPLTRYRLIDTLVHWIECSLALVNDFCISMMMEENTSLAHLSRRAIGDRKDEILVSPRQLILQIFAKLCTNESNVDCILSDLSNDQMRGLGHSLLSIMNQSSEEIDREYCLIIICSLCKRNHLLVQFFNAHRLCIELIFNYLDLYEQNQQQYLIATLTSCCYANGSTPIPMPINHSHDMMIDSCIQLFLQFAHLKENNTLRLFEDRLVDLSSSIYFEQKFLKAFADILYILQS